MVATSGVADANNVNIYKVGKNKTTGESVFIFRYVAAPWFVPSIPQTLRGSLSRGKQYAIPTIVKPGPRIVSKILNYSGDAQGRH